VKNSGTGWREPGTEALDVYSELKTVYIVHEPQAV
jgi:acyl-CoA reductase-like NAD-dependent aldehyde dehydrogenase